LYADTHAYNLREIKNFEVIEFLRFFFVIKVLISPYTSMNSKFNYTI